MIEDTEGIEDEKIIYYITPRLGNEYIICKKSKKLPEPSAYFRSPNTFLKSFLYLSNVEYYNNIHLPKKANMMLQQYLRNVFEKYSKSKENIKYNKIIQVILNNTDGEFDTDPNKNPHYSNFIKLIMKHEKGNIIVIRSDDNGNFMDTVPSKIPQLDITDNENMYYVLMQGSNGLFSPYGKAYKKV